MFREDIMPLIPENIIAMGNVDPSSQFRNGTPESVKARTIEIMEKVGSFKNYVPSSGCDIPPMSPWENILAFFVDTLGWSRQKASLLCCIFVLVASIPCVLGYNVLSNVHIIGARDVLDSEDFIVSNLLLPIGSLVYLLFCVTKWGWGWDNYEKECNTGEGWKMPRALKPFFQFVLPILILVILVQGLR